MSDVLITQAGAVLEVVFNRPEKKNALTGAMYAAVVTHSTTLMPTPRSERCC